ncbi:MAG: prenyltransferase/squalene oxidase repeat-containing protein [Candidatus Thorarchaeota archaeon]
MNRMIYSILEKALNFLYEQQLPWGEFPTYSYLAEEKGAYGLSPFATTFVLHALSFAKQNDKINHMCSRGIKFILDHYEKPGVWRYYGKYIDLIPDMDDTACALSTLIEYSQKIHPGISSYLLKYRDPQTLLFNTWMGHSPVRLENDIDSVVNANILFLYGLLKKDDLIPEVVEFLIKESECLVCQNSQVWYYSPYFFCYVVSRAYADGMVKALEVTKEWISNYLILSQDENGQWRNQIDTACALIALLNFQNNGGEINKAVQFLIEKQSHDGSWEEAMFNFPFASREITTAFCFEGLTKYSNQVESNET